MEFIIGDKLFGLVGWIYLFVKYRNITQMRTALKTKYENQYSLVGREIVSNTVLIIFGLLIILLLISSIAIAIF